MMDTRDDDTTAGPRPDARIDLGDTTPTVERFHRTLMDRTRTEPPWEDFDAGAYDAAQLDEARRQWAARARAEYASTAQFGQLLHRLTLIGAPLQIIGAATRLVRDECRHAEYCTRVARLLGHDRALMVAGPSLSLFEREPDPWVAIYRTILTVCCFGETISVPVLKALHEVSSDPLSRAVTEVIAADEEYHARFGWEVLTWLTPRLTPAQHARVASRLPVLMGHFESVCGGSPQLLESLAGQALEIEVDDPNLGTLDARQYAVIFYHAMNEEILPGLTELGFDAEHAWQTRRVPARRTVDEAQDLSTGSVEP